jgi:hypothetical protein
LRATDLCMTCLTFPSQNGLWSTLVVIHLKCWIYKYIQERNIHLH